MSSMTELHDVSSNQPDAHDGGTKSRISQGRRAHMGVGSIPRRLELDCMVLDGRIPRYHRFDFSPARCVQHHLNASALRRLGSAECGVHRAERCPGKQSDSSCALPRIGTEAAHPSFQRPCPESLEQIRRPFLGWCPRPDLNRDRRFRKPHTLPSFEGNSDWETGKTGKMPCFLGKFRQEFIRHPLLSSGIRAPAEALLGQVAGDFPCRARLTAPNSVSAVKGFFRKWPLPGVVLVTRGLSRPLMNKTFTPVLKCASV